MRRIMIFGTFDLFHQGHQNFLKQTRAYGDYLIVVIARDQTVLEIKKRKSLNNENKRLKNVLKSGLADKVILGSLDNKYQAIQEFRPDIICLGYDQKNFIDKLEAELEKIGLNKTKIIRLKAFKPEIFKASKLRLKLKI